MTFNEECQVLETLIKPRKVMNAFLWAINASASARSEQRVVDITGHLNRDQPWRCWWENFVYFEKGFESGLYNVPLTQKTVAEGNSDPEPGVIRRTSAYTDQDRLSALVDSLGHHLSRAQG